MSKYLGPVRGRALIITAAAAMVVSLVAAANQPRGAAGPAGALAERAVTSAGAPSVAAGDSPAGFWYGTDSTTVTISGSAPYQEPVIGGSYGGYVGMAGNWAHMLGCGGKIVWSSTNSQQANTNYVSYGKGIGTGAYWFMGGPGVDPNYNGTKSEAYAWGERQSKRTLYDISKLHVKYPVVFMDIELPGNAPDFTPAPDNGWNAVYTSPCSGVIKTNYIAPGIDRAEFNGFSAYLRQHSAYKPGVYSAPVIWRDIFGTGTASYIPSTYEWTYLADTSSLTHHPSGWCLANTTICAHFFGGVSRSDSVALMWQWSGGGGTYNGYGDFDQIDANRTP